MQRIVMLTEEMDGDCSCSCLSTPSFAALLSANTSIADSLPGIFTLRIFERLEDLKCGEARHPYVPNRVVVPPMASHRSERPGGK